VKDSSSNPSGALIGLAYHRSRTRYFFFMKIVGLWQVVAKQYGAGANLFWWIERPPGCGAARPVAMRFEDTAVQVYWNERYPLFVNLIHDLVFDRGFWFGCGRPGWADQLL
jgi:hypothetical protein